MTYSTRVILAKVFVSAAIFSLAPLPACFPNLGYQDYTDTHPTHSVDEGEEEKEGSREGGRSLSCYGKSGCSSCASPVRRCFLGQGPASARQQGFTPVVT